MKKIPWITAVLNFIFMGLGYIYCKKKLGLGIGFTIGAMALTYVELQLQELNPMSYKVMFAAVFLVNTCFAIDGYNETKQMN